MADSKSNVSELSAHLNLLHQNILESRGQMAQRSGEYITSWTSKPRTVHKDYQRNKSCEAMSPLPESLPGQAASIRPVRRHCYSDTAMLRRRFRVVSLA